MPADVNKTIAIDMQMDLAQFKAALKQIPGMTKQEASAMVRGLQTELKQAQRASQKAAQVNKKAMQQMGKSFDHAKAKARSLRVQTRNAAGAFGAMEDVVSEINPELGAFATTLGTVGSATRGLARSLASGNVYLIALTVAVTAAIAAYTLFTSSARANEESQKRLNASLKAVNEEIEKQRKLAEDAANAMAKNAGDVNKVVLQYELMSGAISQAEVDQLNMQKSILDMEDTIKEQQKAREDALKVEILLENDRRKAIESRIDDLIAEGTYRDGIRGLTAEAAELEERRAASSARISSLQKDIVDLEAEGVARIQAQVDQYTKAVQGIEELKKKQEAEREAQQKREKARAAALARLKDLEQQITQQQQQQITLAERNRASEIGRMSEREKIVATYAEERQAIEDQKTLLEEQIEMVKENARGKKEKEAAAQFEVEAVRTLVQMEEQQHNLRLDFRQQLANFDEKERAKQAEAAEQQAALEQKLHQERLQQMRNGLKLSIDNLGSFAEFGLKLLAETGNENKTLINVLFRAQQASALANIAMSTAEGIAAAPAQYGPFAPLAIAGIVASAAAQTAVVMQQKPPLHMGGFISSGAPDEAQRTLLSGEAVLDRNTVARLGGQQGVQDLQNGNMQQNVIVMQPFKHLDRYNKSAMMQQNNPLRRLQPRLGSGAY